MRSNGPELSCGDVQRRRGSHSARGMFRQIVTPISARAKSSTAGSVSLSDWLARLLLIYCKNLFQSFFDFMKCFWNYPTIFDYSI